MPSGVAGLTASHVTPDRRGHHRARRHGGPPWRREQGGADDGFASVAPLRAAATSTRGGEDGVRLGRVRVRQAIVGLPRVYLACGSRSPSPRAVWASVGVERTRAHPSTRAASRVLTARERLPCLARRARCRAQEGAAAAAPRASGTEGRASAYELVLRSPGRLPKGSCRSSFRSGCATVGRRSADGDRVSDACLAARGRFGLVRTAGGPAPRRFEWSSGPGSPAPASRRLVCRPIPRGFGAETERRVTVGRLTRPAAAASSVRR